MAEPVVALIIVAITEFAITATAVVEAAIETAFGVIVDQRLAGIIELVGYYIERLAANWTEPPLLVTVLVVAASAIAEEVARAFTIDLAFIVAATAASWRLACFAAKLAATPLAFAK